MIDLLLGGSPCQGFSRNGKGLNFEDPRSKLFFEYVKALEILKPKYFLLENVNMDKEWEDVITEYVGVEPIKINSGLVSAQERLRTYWTNIPGVQQPEDKGIVILDIVENNVTDYECNYFDYDDLGMQIETRNGVIVRNGTKYKSYLRAENGDGVDMAVPKSDTRRGRVHKGKVGTLDTSCKWAFCLSVCEVLGIDEDDEEILGESEHFLRWPTMTEFERLQTIPDGYTSGFSNRQRKKMIGNGWNIDTIAHILSYIPEKRLDNILSLFDGISGGQMSLDRSGIQYDKYYASEIDKAAIQVTTNNYPYTIQIGSVTEIDWKNYL